MLFVSLLSFPTSPQGIPAFIMFDLPEDVTFKDLQIFFKNEFAKTSKLRLPAPPAPSPLADSTSWSGFYKKTLKERQNMVKAAFPKLFPVPSAKLENHSLRKFSTRTSALPSSALRTLQPALPQDPAGPLKSIGNSAGLNGSLEWSRSESLSLKLMDGREYQHKQRKTWLDGVVTERQDANFEDEDDVWPINGLSEDIADNMVENCIG